MKHPMILNFEGAIRNVFKEKETFRRAVGVLYVTCEDMKGSKATVLTAAQKCKTILASNWQGQLSTIKADAKGSKGEIYSSKIKYMVKRGKPFIFIPEKDAHNVNTMIDERGSLAVAAPFPSPLTSLFRSIKRVPSRIALTGEVILLRDEKVRVAVENLEKTIQAQQNAIREFDYAVSGILSSTNPALTCHSTNLQEILECPEKYNIYKFDASSCTYLNSKGGADDVDLESLQVTKADVLAPFSAMLIDGINQSESRRRALVLFCFTYLNIRVRDAYVVSIDCKGLEVLAKVIEKEQFQWKEYRIDFKEVANNVEGFCRLLVEMEEEALKKVSSLSGLS